MKNTEFTVGSHILIQGNKGIVESVRRYNEYRAKGLTRDTYVITDERAEELRASGHEMTLTGRTATYFTVNFDNEPSLKNTTYNHGEYGCLDEFERYGTW